MNNEGIHMNMTTYREKIEALLEHFRYSTKLAEALGVHRMSIPNWRDGKEIHRDNRLKIDLLHARYCIIPSLDADAVRESARRLEDEDHRPWIDNLSIAESVGNKSAFGSLEVEVADANKNTFYRIVEGDTIEKDVDKRTFLEMNNLAFLTRQILRQTLGGRIVAINSALIRQWHYGIMNGIREDAGEYSTKMRVIGNTSVTLTAPEDISEEMEYWVKKYQEVSTIEAIARAHEHFELIHPFGDGNGRAGRLIMTHHFVRMGLVPPLIDAANKGLYYTTLETAQTQGDPIPLLYFLVEAVERMKREVGVASEK